MSLTDGKPSHPQPEPPIFTVTERRAFQIAQYILFRSDRAEEVVRALSAENLLVEPPNENKTNNDRRE